MRNDKRQNHELRPITIETDVNRYAEGSALIKVGHTQVLCTASIETSIPKWLVGSDQGWISAEYGMLPRSTHTRMQREKTSGSGRSQEISRLIGRSLRAVLDMKKIKEKSITVDCDVIQADGGTRTAAITGGFVAMALALNKLKNRGDLLEIPLTDYLAATSVGVADGQILVDLNYEEDSSIETDMNIVMTGRGHFVEIQGTAEGAPFSSQELASMTESAKNALEKVFGLQESLLKDFYKRPGRP